jgi:N-acetylneuraminic acid mutarotase
MERIAQHTKQPKVLRELFEALGNDAFVIAECLARPVLTERLSADLSAQPKTRRFESARTKEVRGMLVATTLGNVAYTLPKISDGVPPCTNDTWTATSTTNAPDGRWRHSAVWTGSEMIVWGGYDGTNYFDTGGRYDPATDSWIPTSTTNAPTGRDNHTAVWSGTEMIVWGGEGSVGYLNTGGRYNPGMDSWTATSTVNSPTGRRSHTAVWAGSEMIVWGGVNNTAYLITGGRYNPVTDSWTATSTTNAPAGRELDTAVWSGSEMIVWGGFTGSSGLNTGGRYNPGTDGWTATNTTFNLPDPRAYHTAVWTGNEMIVWGGYNSSQGDFNTGGRYNPGTDSWTVTSTSSAPELRASHTTVWSGSEMIVWGGVHDHIFLNTGGRYNPTLDSWIATSTTNAPDPRDSQTAIWTGAEMIVWGGYQDFNIYFNTGGRYNPSTDSWMVTSTSSAPAPRADHTGVWTGHEMIVWGGVASSPRTYFNTGGRYCAQGGPSPTPTPTASPTPTPTPTGSATPTPTPSPCDSGVIQNGGFETGSFSPGWVIDGNSDTPVVTNTLSHSGTYSAFVGDFPEGACGRGAETTGDSSFYQQFTVPAGGGILSFWYWTCTTDIITFDWQDAYITDTNGFILQTIFHQCTNNNAWVQQTVNMAPYAGMTVRIKFLVHEDGFGDLTGLYADDVALYVPCGPTPTATPTPTPTPTSTATPTPTGTPTPVPNLSPWTFVARYDYHIDAPAVTTDGTFLYSAGGNHYGATSRFFRYDPAANTWTRLPDVPAAFYAARAVYAANTNSIYVFGGYNNTASATTQSYNIGTGTWRYGAAMPAGRYFSNLSYYPANGKIYVIGGFDANNVQQSQTWEYDPVANTWDTSRAPIPMPMGGSGTGIVGNYIHLVGAWVAQNTHYRYDIQANSWSQMAPLPVGIYEPASGTIGTNIYIIGGGTIGEAYNTTFIYDTLTNTWTTGPTLNLPRGFGAGTAIGPQLLTVGGGTNTGYNDTVETAFTQGGRVVCQYTITPGIDTIVPGTDDTGNHCNDCDTLISLPFSFQLYDQTYNSVNVSSKGRLDFVCDNSPSFLGAQCLPPPASVCQYDWTIFALWGNITTVTNASGCSTWANGCGIFTSVSGTAPNRIFNIEWHTTLPQDPAQTQDFEVRLYENDPNRRFDVIYGTIDAPQSSGAWVDGVQGDLGAGQITRDFCPCCSGYPCTSCGWTPPQNESRTYTLAPCGTPSPTPTATPTPTPTTTPRPTPTPRPRPTPAPRP